MEILAYAADAVTPFNLVLAVLGVVIGTVLGALPGLSSTFSVAVMLPMTFTMAPVSALIFLGAVYTGSTYGGAYTAILVNTPGTPQNIATTFDGFPMAKRGDGNLAITLACLASVAGGLVGALALFAFAPPLAEFALAFGPVEYFWLAVLGLTLIATLSEGSLVKGGISGCFGMAISLIGIAVVSGDTRYTFDLQALLGGIHLVPAVIGLLCVPVLMDLVSVPQAHLDPPKSGTGLRLGEALRLAWRGKVALTRGAILGTVIGVLPAAGGAIASLVAYSETKRSAKNPRAFGTGEPDGVLTTESANNATVGGGLIPTFVLGIPGTPADAVILGALLVHGVRIGPSLFTQQGAIIYTFIFSLLLATVLMLPIGLVMGRYAYRIILGIPKTFLVPLVAFFTIIGSYAIRSDVNDVVFMLVLGILGWFFDRVGFPPAPVVLGALLGPIAEQGYVQGLVIGRATDNIMGQFFGRPIGMVIIAMIVATLLFPYVKAWLRQRRAAAEGHAVMAVAIEAAPGGGDEGPGGLGVRLVDCVAGLVVIALGALLIVESRSFTELGALYPQAVGWVTMALGAILIVRRLLRWRRRPALEPVKGSLTRRTLFVVMLAGWGLSLPWIGIVAGGVIGLAGLAAVANFERWTGRRVVVHAAGLATIFLFVVYVMDQFLSVPMPHGSLF